MLGGARVQRSSRSGNRHGHAHHHAHAHHHPHHPYHHHRQLFPGNALIASPFMTSFGGGHLSPFGMSPFGGFGFGNSGLLCFGGGSGLGGSNSIFSGLDGHHGGGFSSVQSFSSGNGFSPGLGSMRSVSTSTKFINGKKVTTKK